MAPGAVCGTQPGREAPLAAVARRVVEGTGDPAELFEVFLAARVLCVRPRRPGFLAYDEPAAGVRPARPEGEGHPGGGAWVAVFSSLAEFGAFTGGGDWFSLRGADLLDLLPPGHALLLDPAGAAPLRLDPAASRVDPSRSLVFDRPGAGGGPRGDGPGGAAGDGR